MILDSAVTAKDDIYVHEMLKNMRNIGIHHIGESATPCIARLISRLALLRIAVVAHYYSSSRLASHKMIRTLQHVQPRIPG